ncbi:MAG: hypothetical protein QM756_19085 [Polyangiaceae bacterium]
MTVMVLSSNASGGTKRSTGGSSVEAVAPPAPAVGDAPPVAPVAAPPLAVAPPVGTPPPAVAPAVATLPPAVAPPPVATPPLAVVAAPAWGAPPEAVELLPPAELSPPLEAEPPPDALAPPVALLAPAEPPEPSASAPAPSLQPERVNAVRTMPIERFASTGERYTECRSATSVRWI